MNKADAQVYKDIQKNTEMAMQAIDAMRERCYDDEFILLLVRQNVEYNEIHNRAVNKLLEAKIEPYRGNAIDNFFLKMGVNMNTLFNSSTRHIAELMIRGSGTGLTQLWKSLNNYSKLATEATEMAKELIHLEEHGIKSLKKYL